MTLDWRILDNPDELRATWDQVTDFTLWLGQTYVGVESSLKPCWPRHPDVRGELFYMSEWWKDAMQSGLAPAMANWRQALENMTVLWRNSFTQCDAGACRFQRSKADKRYAYQARRRVKELAQQVTTTDLIRGLPDLATAPVRPPEPDPPNRNGGGRHRAPRPARQGSLRLEQPRERYRG